MAGTGTEHLRPDDEVLLSVHDLVVEFPVRNTSLKVHAVSGISLDLVEGETLGLVGESGCGKSTTGRAILQSPRPTSGSVVFDGRELTSLPREAMRRTRPQLQMIFQDPISSLNPRRKIGRIVGEPLDIWWEESFPRTFAARWQASLGRLIPWWYGRLWQIARWFLPAAAIAIVAWVVSEAVEDRPADDWLGWTGTVALILGVYIVLPVFFVLFVLAVGPGLAWVALGLLNIPLSIPRHYRMWRARDEHQAQTDEKVAEVLDAVGISAAEAADRKPHEFSGGQAQRISIARSLILEPKVIICDEPVSALDVSVQAQILNLLQDMKRRYGLTLVFIAHDLAVVKNVSDRVAVMYLGKLCEVADPDTLYAEPAHPYTAALLSAIPEPDPTRHVDTVPGVGGELPSPIDPPSGCRFRTRCPRAEDVCANEEPLIHRTAENHYVACHFPVAPGEPVAPSDDDLASLAPRGDEEVLTG